MYQQSIYFEQKKTSQFSTEYFIALKYHNFSTDTTIIDSCKTRSIFHDCVHVMETKNTYKPRHEKTCFLHMQEQRRRSAAQ